MRSRRVGIVGGGIIGVSAARELGRRGHEVTLFEQFALGHDRGSSHGRSRIIRRAYADSYYTECMHEAYPMWWELERASGKKLLHEVGLLYFGHEDQQTVRDTEEGLIEFKVPYQRLRGEDVRSVFPCLVLGKNEVALFTPEAGWIRADLAVQATYELARGHGVRFVDKVADPDDLKRFDKVLIAAGPWIKNWWPEAPVKVTLQTFAYLDLKVEGPVWIEDTPNLLYGFPSDDFGLKIGVHRPGPEIDPSSPNRAPAASDLDLIKEFAQQRFQVEEPVISESKGCLYTNTETEDFLLSQLDDRTTIASACSGHGFKFGPWFGRLLTDIAEDRTDVACYGRFLA